jgi:hypothetical protein
MNWEEFLFAVNKNSVFFRLISERARKGPEKRISGGPGEDG